MLSVIIPALNEEGAIGNTIAEIRLALEGANIPYEIVVVDDGSTDRTRDIASGLGVIVLRHPSAAGYGKSLKDGILYSHYDLIAITDGDGTYPNSRLPELYRLVSEAGFDMAVGARTGSAYRGSILKMPARRVFLWLSEYATGTKIPDINSGLRVFRKGLAVRYMHTIGDKFSFTTTITLAALLNGHFVEYLPIDYYRRVGKSHIRYWRDTLRSLQIITENILYYNPLKLFLLIVNFLFFIALLAGGGCLASERYHMQFEASMLGLLGIAAFVGAFIVGAIGLSADLGRIAARNLGSTSQRETPLQSPCQAQTQESAPSPVPSRDTRV